MNSKLPCKRHSILFVCWGNICRSPMAEFIMKDIVKRRGMSELFHIESAAHTGEEIGNAVYPPARRELEKHGLDCSGKCAREIVPQDYKKFDLIIGMEQINIRYILSRFGGDPEHKVHRLLDYTESPRDIADPWYTGEFELTYNEIAEGCEALLNSIL